MWKVIKCAVQGIGHIDKGIPCQDKVYSLTANDVTTIALADGCGSSKLSHYGAETITKFICEKFCNNFDVIYNDEDGVNVKKQIINDILEQWSILAQGKECEIKDLRSTLLFVSVKGNHYILTHIGDGILGYLKGDELKVALMPKKEGAANETFYPDSSVCLQIMQLIKGELNTINGFVLLSDGTEASLYDKRKEQLADIMGVPAESKKAWLDSIAHYNELCAAGADTDFGKDPSAMIPVLEAPFYGCKGNLGNNATTPMMVTMSGVMTDLNLNVTDVEHNPIPGLYAAGNCLGGRYGIGYSTPCAGNSIGMAVTHGRLAGQFVVDNEK